MVSILVFVQVLTFPEIGSVALSPTSNVPIGLIQSAGSSVRITLLYLVCNSLEKGAPATENVVISPTTPMASILKLNKVSPSGIDTGFGVELIQETESTFPSGLT